jgi:hypothetical protein
MACEASSRLMIRVFMPRIVHGRHSPSARQGHVTAGH